MIIFPEILSRWLKHQDASAKLEQLTKTISEVNKLLAVRQDLSPSRLDNLVKKQIELAEAEFKNAEQSYQRDVEYCLRRIEFGLFQLELAKQELACNEEAPSAPNFAPGSAEHIALSLSGAIIDTKMAVEYCNCVISEEVNLDLLRVVQIFNSAVTLLRVNEREKSKHNSQAGLLLLYQIKCQIELENGESIIDLQKASELHSAELKPLTELVDTLYRLKEASALASPPLAKKCLINLSQALEHFNAVIDAYLQEELDLIEELSHQMELELELVRQLFEASSLEANDPGEPAENQPTKRSDLFKSRLILLKRLTANRAPQANLAGRRLDSALYGYLSAAAKLSKAAELSRSAERTKLIDDAEKLALKCQLDIDFAGNLLLSKEERS